jgi:hypothetical protein
VLSFVWVTIVIVSLYLSLTVFPFILAIWANDWVLVFDFVLKVADAVLNCQYFW